MEIERKLAEMGLAVTEPNPAIGNFVPAVRTGNLVFVSGNLPRLPDGTMPHTGKLGSEVSVEEGAAARPPERRQLPLRRQKHNRRSGQGAACRQAAGDGQQRPILRPAAPGGQRRIRPARGTLRRIRTPRPFRSWYGRPPQGRTRGSGDDYGSSRLAARRSGFQNVSHGAGKARQNILAVQRIVNRE